MRGGAVALAAQLLCIAPVVSAIPAQSLVRTRDVGVAAVQYDNGLTLGAMSLFETVTATRGRGVIDANWLLSLFSDGRWSMQGSAQGARASDAVSLAPAFARYFRDVRGEVALSTSSTAQQGLMPTLQVDGASRLRFEGPNRELLLGARVARTFDGFSWRTTVLGDAGVWGRRGSAVYSARVTPMQLQYGDVLADVETGVSLPVHGAAVEAAIGTRLGEARRGTVGWGSLTATVPIATDVWATLSAGLYPVDLLQGLPGGRYMAINFRVPNDRLPWQGRSPVLPPRASPAPLRPELLVTERLTLAVGAAWDSTSLREIRVWAPGVDVVEVMADFTDWLPAPLERTQAGEWRGYYRITAGAHRLNLRLNGRDVEVPVNLARVNDEFSGTVGVVIVR